MRSGLSIASGLRTIRGFILAARAIDAHLEESIFRVVTLLPLLAFVDGWLLRKLTSTQHKVGLWPQVLANPATYFNCYMAVWAAASIAQIGWSPEDAIVLAMLGVLWLICAGTLAAGYSLARLLRPTPGVCRHCGYSTIGNTSGQCPECGRRVPCAASNKTETGN